MREFSERNSSATRGARVDLARSVVVAALSVGLGVVLTPSIALAQAVSGEPSCGSEISPDVNASDRQSLLDTVAHLTTEFAIPAAADFPAVIAGKARFPEEGTQSTVLFVGPRVGVASGQPSSDASTAAEVQLGWRGYYIQEQASFAKAYASPQTGQALLFSMLSVEGLGHDYQVVSTDDAFATVRCGTVPPPDTMLDTLDFMDIQTVQLNDKGNGQLTGIVRFGDDRRPECFVSRTSDGGVQWTVPSKVGQCIDDALAEISREPEGDDALSSLRQSVGL